MKYLMIISLCLLILGSCSNEMANGNSQNEKSNDVSSKETMSTDEKKTSGLIFSLDEWCEAKKDFYYQMASYDFNHDGKKYLLSCHYKKAV